MSRSARTKTAKPRHAVDAVVLGVNLDDAVLKVLLVQRAVDPFAGWWALPGGFVRENEGLDAAVHRELGEETGVTLSFMEQLYTFGHPERDPRGRVISTGYLGLVRPDQVPVQGGTDAACAAWWDTRKLPKLAFDHDAILEAGIARLRSKLPWQPVGIELLPATFTLTDLQRVYEIILGRDIDKRNFRRKVLSFDVLTATDETRSEGHRPAQLYRFDRKRYAQLRRQEIDFEI